MILFLLQKSDFKTANDGYFKTQKGSQRLVANK